jgi:FtsP/CotA-like multicopper oxidase with cupredoxin domain
MVLKTLNRRDFIALSSLSVAGGLMYPLEEVRGQRARRRGSRRRGGGNEIIDPLPGDLLTDPATAPNLSDVLGVVEVELEAAVAPVNIRGSVANLLTYNGAFPAPTILVKKGDLLRVRFKNSLPMTNETNILGFRKNVTNLHTHGWHVSPSGNADNIFLHFEPGEEFLFEYDTSKQEAGTLNWYHPHVHGLVAEQLWGGLAGALVVEDSVDALSDYETHILVLKDIELSGSEPDLHSRSDFMRGKEGDIVMVNGQVNPVLPIKPGQVQRWRIVNTSTARYYKLSLEGHSMFLVGTDANLLDQPYPLTEILVTPGERIDVLVRADQPAGSYKFLSLPYSRGGNNVQTVTLLTVSYEGNSVAEAVPSVIGPGAERPDIDTSTLQRRRLVLQMRMGRGLINGHDFEVDPYVIDSEVGTYEVWRVVNRSMMDHPFHQHTNPALILRINGGDPGYSSLYTSIPGWKDTINVPRMGSVEMLVPVRDFTGRTVYHCHIVEHEDIGMMGIWELM